MVMFLFFPLVFMYVKSYLDPGSRRFRQHLIHFIPSAAYFAAMMPFFLKSGAEKVVFLQEGKPEWVSQVFNVGNIVVILQGIVYTILSVNLLHRFQYFTDKKLTRNQQSSIRWLWQFVIINVVLWATGTTGAFLEVMEIRLPFDPFIVFFVGVTFITLRTGYFSIRYPTFFILHVDSIRTSPEIKPSRKETEKNKEELDVIVSYFEDKKPYLKKDFNLSIFSNKIGIPKHRISELINTELEKSFSDFVNEYRVKEVVRLLEEGKHVEKTLIYIGEEAGFNSKANFFRIFKKVMGMTPNEFIKTREG